MGGGGGGGWNAHLIKKSWGGGGQDEKNGCLHEKKSLGGSEIVGVLPVNFFYLFCYLAAPT